MIVVGVRFELSGKKFKGWLACFEVERNLW